MRAVLPIRTARLELVPATLVHLEADLESPSALGRLLGAAVPDSWPPGEYDRSAMEFFRDRLSEDGEAVGWYGWYAVHRPAPEQEAVVIGAAGYLGPPSPEGSVEIGYSIAPEFQARAFATEIVDALVARAFSLPGIARIVAHTTQENAASLRVLERCGFTPVEGAAEPGAAEYERWRPAT